MARVKHVRLWIALGAVALVALFVAGSLSRSGQRGQTEVRLEPLRRERVEAWVRAPGSVRAERFVQISSNLMGRVEGLSVVEGDRVHRGDLLLRLDDERYRSTLAGMQATVDAAQADLRLAEAQRERSRLALARQEKLFAEGLLSDEGIEAARAQAAIDQARHASAQEELRRRQAALGEVRKDLNETVFLAPMDGIVTALNVEEGENVVTGTMNNAGTVILTLANLDTMEVAADVDETDVVAVRSGQKAKVKVDAWQDSVLTGVVTTVGMSGRRGTAGGQQQATNFEVKVRIEEPPDGLRPGMSADIEVLTGERDSALVVPIQALIAHPERVVQKWMEDRANPPGKGGRNQKKTTDADAEPDSIRRNEKLIEGVFLERDGKARFVPVRLGLRGDTSVEVTGDLQVKEKVVTGPYRTLRKLKDGDAIKPEKKKTSKGKAGADQAEVKSS